MPFKCETSGDAGCAEVSDDDEESDADISDHENEEFLDSIGLNKDTHFPSMREQERLNKKANLRKLDHRPESTVFISGTEVHSLFNFLLNADFLCAPSGPMTGIPPTLLSPVAFIGASLKTCKFSHGPLRQHGREEKKGYCIDISGPILPNQLWRLTKLFQQSQNGTISIHTKSFPRTSAFNSVSVRLQTAVTDPMISETEVANFGLTSDEHEYLTREVKETDSDGSGIVLRCQEQL